MVNGNYELVVIVLLLDLNYLKSGSKVEFFFEDIFGSW